MWCVSIKGASRHENLLFGSQNIFLLCEAPGCFEMWCVGIESASRYENLLFDTKNIFIIRESPDRSEAWRVSIYKRVAEGMNNYCLVHRISFYSKNHLIVVRYGV